MIFQITFSNDKKKILKFNSTMRREKKICERKKTFKKKRIRKFKFNANITHQKKHFSKKKFKFFIKKIQKKFDFLNIKLNFIFVN